MCDIASELPASDHKVLSAGEKGSGLSTDLFENEQYNSISSSLPSRVAARVGADKYGRRWVALQGSWVVDHDC
jgi:hypothetical protein